VPRSEVRTRGWIFGSEKKRLLIHALIAHPSRRWNKGELAREIGAHPKGGVDEHLTALEQIGLVARIGEQWGLVRTSQLLGPLRRLLGVVERLPDETIKRP